MILALDLGSTSWKAALYTAEGRCAGLSRIPTPTGPEGAYTCFPRDGLQESLRQLLSGLPGLSDATAVALTGMAESGGFVSRKTGAMLTSIRPWYDGRSMEVFDRLRNSPAFAERSRQTGLPTSYKYGVFKLLDMAAGLSEPIGDVCFLGVVEQAALLLTGRMATDETLAARTLAFSLPQRCWDRSFLAALGLPETVLPPIAAPGMPMGETLPGVMGLPGGIPVCIAGHDHVCAAFGADVLTRGGVMVSMGTAQVMLCEKKTYAPEDALSGLSYGPSPTGRYTCLGSIQSAGASVNCWKNLLFPGEDYASFMAEAAAVSRPTGMVYLPYLSGSGAPHLEPHACAALAGLRADATRGALAAAIYEGLAMETRCVLEAMGEQPRLVCAGGLTRHERLMQTLADVTGAQVCLPAEEEGTLYGAARIASGPATGTSVMPPLSMARTLEPEAALHRAYTDIYQQTYKPLMKQIIALGEEKKHEVCKL